MELRALKSPDKKPVLKAPQDLTSFLYKIPVPIKSPKQKKAKRQVTNNIICSTPVNAIKRKIFEDENQQISPIRNPSSTSSKTSSSSQSVVNGAELENKLQVNKLSKMSSEKEPENREAVKDNFYDFPLLSKVPIYNMILCDSDSSDIFPKKSENRKKRTRVVATYVTSDKDTQQANHKIENVRNLRARKEPESTSNTHIVKNASISNEKIVTGNNIRTILTRSKTELTDDKNVTDEETAVKNIPENIDDKNERKRNLRPKNNSNASTSKSKKLKSGIEEIEIISKIKNNSDEKIKKDILNGKTKCSINLRSNENKNNADNNDDLIITKSTEKDNININPISSHKTRKAKKNVLNGKVADKKTTNLQVFDVSNGTHSSIVVHSLEDNTKNTNTQNSDNLNNIKVHKQKRKTRKPEMKNLESVESSQELRKSSRKRIPSSKYWLMNSDSNDEQTKKEIKNSMDKKSIKSTGKLKTISIKNKKTTKTKLKDLLKVVRKSSRSPVKLQTNELPVTNEKLLRTPEKNITDEIPIINKKVTRATEKRETNGRPKEVNKTTQFSKSKKSQDFKKLSNECKILTAGKIRKSLVLEHRVLKFSTPRKTPKKQTILEFSDKDDYTTEEENDVPRDTLLLNTGIDGIEKFPSSEKGQKRKGETNEEIYQKKKVRLQTEQKYSFKNMALSADMTLAKAGGLADVQLDGKRCLLGCFGKYPRHNQSTQNSDVSVGVSINNGNITTGVLEIEPAGRKKYEYAKKVDLLFLVLEGRAEVGIGNSSQVLRLGQDFYVPKDTPYYILNVSSTDKLVIYFSRISK